MLNLNKLLCYFHLEIPPMCSQGCFPKAIRQAGILEVPLFSCCGNDKSSRSTDVKMARGTDFDMNERFKGGQYWGGKKVSSM